MIGRIGLFYDRLRWEEKILYQRGKELGLDINLIDTKSIKLDSQAFPEAFIEENGALALQRCIGFYRGLHLTGFLESKALKVINSFETTQTCGNKLLTTLALTRARVPTPRTIVSFTREAALEAADNLGYPVVNKPLVGSWGRMVVALKDKQTAQAVFEMKEELNSPLSQIYYIQEMIKKPERDIRGIVVGDQIITCVYRKPPPGEWRSNVARGATSSPCPITSDLEEIMLGAAKAVGGGILGVDAMESPDGLVIHEVNSTVEFRGAASVGNVDIAGSILGFAANLIKK